MMWAITGASGFIGSSLVRMLDAAGIASKTLSRRPMERAAHVCGDVRDPAALRRLVEDADVVVHLAAVVHRSVESRAARAEYWSTNVDATRSLVEALRRHRPGAFLISLSSSNVYGRSSIPVDETFSADPQTLYGATKLAGESIVLEAARRGDIVATVLRPSMVFGVGSPGNLGRLIRLIDHGLFPRIASGEQRKSLLPVEELVRVMFGVAGKQHIATAEMFNVTAQPPVTIAEIGRIIAAARDKAPLTLDLPAGGVRAAVRLLRMIPLSASAALARTAEVFSTDAMLDDTKLRHRLGIPQTVDVIESLRRAVTEIA